jgi:hypothetical protein
VHPVILGQVAQDHIRSLVEEADTDRLAHLARAEQQAHSPRLRRRVGLGLIAVGNKLACDDRGLAGVPGGRA